MNWRGRPLTSHEVVVNSIAATRTRTACTSDSRSRSAPSSTASAKPWPSSVTKAAAVRIRPRLPVTSPRARVSAGRPRNFSPASRARGANVSVAARVTSWPAWRSTAPSPVYGATSPRDPAAAITILIGFLEIGAVTGVAGGVGVHRLAQIGGQAGALLRRRYDQGEGTRVGHEVVRDTPVHVGRAGGEPARDVQAVFLGEVHGPPAAARLPSSKAASNSARQAAASPMRRVQSSLVWAFARAIASRCPSECAHFSSASVA